jgi:WD40 repeat protein
VDSSTTADVVTAIELASKECGVLAELVNDFGLTPRVLGLFATVSTNALSVFVNGNVVYVLNNNQIDLYNATTFAYTGSVLGFNRAGEIAFNSTSYVVVNFGNNTARVMDIVTNTEITSFPVIANPLSVCFNPDGTLIYVASLTTASTISYYNLSGVLQGTVSGFDALITEMRAVGSEYWVLTGTGTIASNTQRVRKMRFSDNTQVSTHSLGTVVTIGQIRAMVVTASKVYVSVNFGSLNVYKVICYNLDFTSPVTLNVGLVGQGAYGLTANPNKCDSFIMVNPNAETCYNLAL